MCADRGSQGDDFLRGIEAAREATDLAEQKTSSEMGDTPPDGPFGDAARGRDYAILHARKHGAP